MFLDPEKSLNLFSRSGKLTQCDNALKAALNSALSMGCASEDGVVLISSKNLGPLVVKKQFYKVFQVCPSIGVTYSGLQPDFRAQLSVAQKICQDYFDVYQRFPYLDVFMNEFCIAVQQFSQKSGLRPFGTFLIFAGETREGSCCFQMDPSGSFKKVSVVASGKDFEEARKFLERRKENLDDNIVNSLLAVKEFSGIELKPEDISIGIYSRESHLFKVYSDEQIQEIFDSIQN